MRAIWAQAALGRMLDMARHLVLPVLALALHHLTFVALLTRTRVMAEMERPYVVTAAAKGVAPRLVRRRHALPNAMLSLVSLFGSRLGAFVAGAVTIEVLFALPGLGRLAVTSAVARDHPVVIGLVLFTTAIVVVTNLVVDLAFRRLDPRLEDSRVNRHARSIAAAIVALLYLACVAFAPAGALQSLPMSAPFLPPSLAHPLGTDDLGRDMLSALAQGGQHLADGGDRDGCPGRGTRHDGRHDGRPGSAMARRSADAPDRHGSSACPRCWSPFWWRRCSVARR